MKDSSKKTIEKLKGVCGGMLQDLEDMSGDCDHNASFLQGDSEAAEPAEKRRMYNRTNPEFNGAWLNIDKFFSYLEVPEVVEACWPEVINVLRKSEEYVKKLQSVFPACEFEDSRTAIKEVENLLIKRKEGLTGGKAFLKELEELRKKWRKCFHGNGRACYQRHTEVLAKRHQVEYDVQKRFPGFRPGKYILGVLDGCDRDKEFVEIHGIGKFYMPYNGSQRWKVVAAMVESQDDLGYVDLKLFGKWQALFQGSHIPEVPSGRVNDFVGGPREFFLYIRGTSCKYHIESKPRKNK